MPSINDMSLEDLPTLYTPGGRPIPNVRLWYVGYLGTKWWKQRRLRALKLGKYRCKGCGIQENCDLHVHHLTYERLGCEEDDDLEVLCSECHGKHSGAEGSRWLNRVAPVPPADR